MRQAKVLDFWRHVNKLERYPLRVSKIVIRNVEGFANIDINLSSGITVVCGRNGSGKTTFLKIIYRILSKDDEFFPGLFSRLNLDDVIIEIDSRDDGVYKYRSNDLLAIDYIDYFDPADLCLKIQRKILSDSNVDDWIEGVDPSKILNDNIEIVRRVTGKKYDFIEAYEVADIFPNDEVFPYFRVSLKGSTYTNESMGLGEHKLLLMLWKVLSIEANGLLLIEEPEAFVCPKSQHEFMDVLAYVGSSKRACFIITSHSEHIVSKATHKAGMLFSDRPSKGFSVVGSNHSYKYMEALGLSAPKIGSILIEDEFAAKVIKKILIKYDSPLLYSHNLDVQNGESNIEKLLKHNKSSTGFKVIGLFDADYKGRLNEGNYIWPVCYLPGTENLAPEILVINEIKANVEEFSVKINHDKEKVIDAISEEIDHHDFFLEVADTLKAEPSSLKDWGIDLWIEKNAELVEELVFVLENHSKTLRGVVVYDEDCSMVNVNDTQLFMIDANSKLLDFSKMAGLAVEGRVEFIRGVPSFKIVNM